MQVLLRSLVRLRLELSEHEDVRLIIKLMHARSSTNLSGEAGETTEQLSVQHFKAVATQVRLVHPAAATLSASSVCQSRAGDTTRLT